LLSSPNKNREVKLSIRRVLVQHAKSGDQATAFFVSAPKKFSKSFHGVSAKVSLIEELILDQQNQEKPDLFRNSLSAPIPSLWTVTVRLESSRRTNVNHYDISPCRPFCFFSPVEQFLFWQLFMSHLRYY
jgi:hypothetical protein